MHFFLRIFSVFYFLLQVPPFFFLFTADSFNLFAALWKLKSECVNSAGRSWTQLATTSLALYVGHRNQHHHHHYHHHARGNNNDSSSDNNSWKRNDIAVPLYSKPFALQIPQMSRRKDNAVSFQLNSFVRFPFSIFLLFSSIFLSLLNWNAFVDTVRWLSYNL